MKYLSEEIITTAWQNLKTANVPGRIVGLLHIFKSSNLSSDEYIEPLKDFDYDLSKIKKSLDELFDFSLAPIAAANPEPQHAIVAKDWVDATKKYFLPNININILDIAIVFTWPYEVEDDFDENKLISRFQKEYHLSDDVANTLFRKELYALTFNETVPDRAALKTRICGSIGITNEVGKNTLIFKKAVDKRASDLGAGPFYQPLYANDKLNEIIILTRNNAADKYNISPAYSLTASKPNKIRNRIIYGAPGTGKSRLLEKQSKQFGDRIRRITFHSDYSNAQFIGSFRPRPLYIASPVDSVYETMETVPAETAMKRRPVLDYKITPGPFLLSLKDAICDPGNDYLLLIEEINRGNTASIFGDVFQLLDRKDDVSIYAINLGKEVSLWLEDELSKAGKAIDGVIVRKNGETLDIKLPNNLYLWATMNNADQGVMPLDTAFKRRWSFEYVSLDDGKELIQDWEVLFLGRKVSWSELRTAINKFLMRPSREGRVQIPEDKLIGPFFIKAEECQNKYIIRDKILLYLREDVVRHNPKTVFNAANIHFSSLHTEYTKITDNIHLNSDSEEKFLLDLSTIFQSDLAKHFADTFQKLYEPSVVIAETLVEELLEAPSELAVDVLNDSTNEPVD